MHDRTTRNIAKKGFNGMRSSSPASISLYLDSDILRNPFHAILPTLVASAPAKKVDSKIKALSIRDKLSKKDLKTRHLFGLTTKSRLDFYRAALR